MKLKHQLTTANVQFGEILIADEDGEIRLVVKDSGLSMRDTPGNALITLRCQSSQKTAIGTRSGVEGRSPSNVGEKLCEVVRRLNEAHASLPLRDESSAVQDDSLGRILADRCVANVDAKTPTRPSNPSYQSGMPILDSDCTVSWRYLPSFREAKKQRHTLRDLLLKVRRPRKHPVTMGEWQAMKSEYQVLADELSCCRVHNRCRSLACPVCMRSAALVQYCKILKHFDGVPLEELSFLTILPNRPIEEADLSSFSPREFKAWLLKDLRRRNVGLKGAVIVAEIKYVEIPYAKTNHFEPHWHAIVPNLTPQDTDGLKELFPLKRAVVVKPLTDWKLIPYLCKTQVKGHRGLDRRTLPPTRTREIAAWLDKWDADDFIICLDQSGQQMSDT